MNVRDRVNGSVPFHRAWYLTYGEDPPYGKVFCPFHDNTVTPAAKIYSYGLRCFGECNRVYTSYDLLKRFAPTVLDQILSEVVLALSERQSYNNGEKVEFNLESYYGIKI